MSFIQGLDFLPATLGGGALSWLHMKAAVLDGFGDFVFFHFVLERLQHDVAALGEAILGRMMKLVTLIAFSALTLWVMLKGYQAITGQLRESMAGLVISTAKAVIIVTVATGFSMNDQLLTKFVVQDLQGDIYEIVTGEVGDPGDGIDENLAWMQVAMSSIDALDPGSDLGVAEQKSRASTMIGIGSGGPALVGGALLLMYQVAMALFIGFGPLFILCLLFDATKSLFQKWLLYGIGTMFSMAVLAAMTTIALKMVTDVAAAMWATDVVSKIFFDGDTMSYSSRALQQGGLGTILTLLLITVPPMAANFFSGTLGSFMHFSALGGMGGAMGGRPGPQGQPPGSYQPAAYRPPEPAAMAGNRNDATGPGFNNNPGATVTGTNYSAVPDQAKQGSQMPSRDVGGGGNTPSASAPASQGGSASTTSASNSSQSSLSTQRGSANKPPTDTV